MSVKKIRPSRILEGVAKMVLNKNTESSIKRLETCKECPVFTNGWCDPNKGGCGCVIDAKTKVLEEYCPKNNWEDVKILESEGIALVNMSTDKGELILVKEGFIFKFNDLKHKEEAVIDLKVVNDRSNFMKSGINLKGISMGSTCGCTIPSDYPTILKDGANFDFKIKYDSNRMGAFNKTIKIIANDKLLFKVSINGVVK